MNIKLIPITIEMIDSLLVSNDDIKNKFGLTNDAGEYLVPSPDYLNKIKTRMIEHPNEYPLAVDHLIVLDNIVIGSIYFKYLPKDGVSEIGYGMTPTYEGHGYMSKAVKQMVIFGKNNGVTTILADTMKDNIKSQNVLKRTGFEKYNEKDNMLYYRLDI